MRHTSGIIYGGRGTTAVHKVYPAGSTAAAVSMTGSEFLDRVSGLPLLHQPGAVWDYGFGLCSGSWSSSSPSNRSGNICRNTCSSRSA